MSFRWIALVIASGVLVAWARVPAQSSSTDRSVGKSKPAPLGGRATVEFGDGRVPTRIGNTNGRLPLKQLAQAPARSSGKAPARRDQQSRPAAKTAPAPATAGPPRRPAARAPQSGKAAPRIGRLTGPTEVTRQTIQAVAALLAQRHLVPRVLDDDMSRQWMANYVDALDNYKVLLLQSEVDRFLNRQSELGDKAKLGDARLAYEIYKLCMNRMQQRTVQWVEMLKSPIDFTQDERLELSPKNYPGDEQQVLDRMRRIVKYHVLTYKAQAMDEPTARKKLARRYRLRLARFLDYDDQNLLELYVGALVKAYDRESAYAVPRTSGIFNERAREQMEGIGASLAERDGEVQVAGVIPGGPAAKDGRLKKGDFIVGVGEGSGGAVQDVRNLKLSEVVRRIRGKAGTVVRVQIGRAGESQPRTINIVRAKVQVQQARGVVLERGRKADGAPYKIGVINVPSLYAAAFQQKATTVRKTSTDDVRRILEDPKRGFKGAGVDVVVLDMRLNPGGTLDEAISLAGLFIDSGPIIQVRNRAGKVTHYDDLQRGTAWNGPLVVLTSRYVGSGCELIAAALQDYKRALIVGDTTTAGHGTLRSAIDVTGPKGNAAPANLGLLMMVTEQLYRVNGESPQQRGVAADVVLSSSYEGSVPLESEQPGSIPPDRIEAINHARLDRVRPEYTAALQKLSAGRRDSDEFRQLARRIAILRAYNKADTMPLVERKALAVLKVLSEEEKFEVTEFEKSFVNSEALNIAVDYARMLQRKGQAPK